MPWLPSTLLSFAAIAFWAGACRWPERALGGVTAMLAVAACIRTWGLAQGLVIQVVLGMTAASLLVLVLPPRAPSALQFARASALLGAVGLLDLPLG